MRISVAMATYNGDKYLTEQLTSIIKQSCHADEIIICDDCSTDQTQIILSGFALNNQVSFIINNERLGFIRNFKKAVSLTTPDSYVALCDQDDYWLPHKLEKNLAELIRIEEPNLPCIVYSDLMYVDDSGQTLNPSFRNEYGQDKYCHNLQTLLFSNFVTGCTIMMNAKAVQYFEDMPDDVRYHDEWLALVAFTFGKAAEITEPLVRYRRHQNNLSISNNTRPKNRIRSLIEQIWKAISGNDDFLESQFKVVRRFYNKYSLSIPREKQRYFQNFLKLEHRSYLVKKLAFNRVVRESQR